LFLSFLFISLTLIALTGFAYQYYIREVVYKENNRMLRYVAEQTTHNVEMRLQLYMKLSTIPLTDQNFLQTVRDISPKTSAASYGFIKNYLDAMLFSNNTSLAHIAIYTRNGNLKKDGDVTQWLGDELLADVYEPLRLKTDNMFWKGTWKDDRGQKVFALYRRIPATSPSNRTLLEIQIYETDLFSLIFEGKPQYQLYIVSDTGTVMSSTNRSLLGKNVAGMTEPDVRYLSIAPGIANLKVGQAEYAVAKTKTTNGWSVVAVVELTQLYKELKDVDKKTTIVSVVAVALALLLTLFLSNRLNRRVVMLNKKIQYIRRGEFDREVRIPGHDEFTMLSEAMDATRMDLKSLIAQIKAEGEQRRQAEMDALRSQINAHFIFNTLSGIRRMALHRDMGNVAESIGVLSSFLRISLTSKRDFITVEKELEHLRSYFYLQKMRYAEDIDVRIDADEDTLRLYTVRLILQPMVENAIFHGRRADGSVLHIAVRSYLSNNRLVFEIEDDGAGMDRERLISVQQGAFATGKGYGISNVVRRIRLCCGEAYGVSIDSQVMKGTKVTIAQPIKETE
jgi:two-component system sensor histidine kinase YesM